MKVRRRSGFGNMGPGTGRSSPTRIRIAILIGEVGLGGSERQLTYLLKHRDRSRFEYDVIVLNQSCGLTYDHAIQALGVELRRCPESTRSVWQRILWLARLLREIKADVVHSWSFYANPYAVLSGWMAGVRVRMGSLRIQPDARCEAALPPFHRWLAYRSVDGLVVNSRQTLEQVQTKGYRVRHVYLVNNGIELPQARERARKIDIDLTMFGITDVHRVVGTVGNLRARKNQRMFIEAMSRILPHFPDVRCLIVGQPVPTEPDLPAQLQDQIHQLGLADRIILTGGREDALLLMQRFDVFCLTSYSEGTPNALLEAMAAGCPVVATPVGDVPHIIQAGENGLLVNIDDAGALAEAVSRLLTDVDLAERMGRSGRRTVEEQFSCSLMASAMERLYHEAVAGRW